MRAESNGLVYDDDDPRCHLEFSQSQGQHYAFIVALDHGMPGTPLKTPEPKRYWGRFCPHQPEESIKVILQYGGDWPQLHHR